MILRKIKNDAEFYLKKNINEVVITTPAYFNQMQRKATMQAAEIAGLKVRKIINEPTAASIAYAYAYESEVNLGNKILIFDFGGGTLDLTLLNYTKKGLIISEVLCSSGDTHLGGQDIDNKIYGIILNEYKEQITKFRSKYGNRDETIGKFRLLKACEKAKIILSEQFGKNLETEEQEEDKDKGTDIIVDSFLPTINIKYTLTKGKLDEIIKDFFEDRIKKCFESFFKKANVQKREIENIIFVGGSSKLPKLEDLIKDYFGNQNLKILSTIEPTEVVAKGAGIIAGQIKGEKKLEKFKLLDVTSLSLGTNLIDGKMDIIIPKNLHPPITKTKSYFTTVDNQEIISNKVYEGEEEYIKNNYLLADFKIKNLTKRKKGKTGIELTFHLTSNFLLSVTAKELKRIDGKNNEQLNFVKLDEPKNVFKLEEINEMKDFIDKNYESDWQKLFDREYQKRIIDLKNQLNNTQEKYKIQKEIVKVIDELLHILKEQKKEIKYKIYSLYLVYYFYEINNLFRYKENLDEKEIIDLIIELDLEKKIEIVMEEIKEIIWEIIDIFNDKKLFYNYIKITSIEILFMNIQYQLIFVDFSNNFIPKIKNYKKIIADINLNLSEYESILKDIQIDILKLKKEMCIENIKKYKKKLEIKQFIIDFYSSNNKCHEVTLDKCNDYILNYFYYDLTLQSTDFLKLKEISFIIRMNNYGINLSEQNFQKYKNLLKFKIYGEYHGKKEYIDNVDRSDNIDSDNNEKAYKNLDKFEQDIIDIINKSKNSITLCITQSLSKDSSIKDKLNALFYIIKNFYPGKSVDAEKLKSENNLDEMKLFTRAIFTYDKTPDTIIEFEKKIRDEYILNELSSNNII